MPEPSSNGKASKQSTLHQPTEDCCAGLRRILLSTKRVLKSVRNTKHQEKPSNRSKTYRKAAQTSSGNSLSRPILIKNRTIKIEVPKIGSRRHSCNPCTEILSDPLPALYSKHHLSQGYSHIPQQAHLQTGVSTTGRAQEQSLPTYKKHQETAHSAAANRGLLRRARAKTARESH